MRTTVANVLDGAEDVLSIFFSNSGSALRRVKSQERPKRRPNAINKEAEGSATEPASVSGPDPDIHMRHVCTAATMKSPLFLSPSCNKNFTQWTPLSLSEVQEPKHVLPWSERLSSHSQNRSGASQVPDSALDVSPALVRSTYPRKFVYRVKGSSRGGKQTSPAVSSASATGK